MKKRIIKGIMSGGFGQAVTMSIQLISIPLLLNYWGVELYGEWLIISSIPAYLTLSNIGLPTTAGNAIAMLGEPEQLKKLEIYQSTWVMVTVLSVLVMVIFLLCIYFINIYDIVNIKIISREDFHYTIILLLVHVILTFQTGILKIAYRAIKRNPFGNFLNYLTRLLEWIFASIAVFYGKGVFEVALCFVVVRQISNTLQWVILKFNKNKLYIGVSHFKIKIIKSLLKPSLATMCFPLGLALTLQGMIILIGHFLSPASVVIFTIYRTLTRIIVQFSAIINHSIWPEISYAFSEKNISLVKKLTRRSQIICLISGLIFSIFLHFYNEEIIIIWIKASLNHDINLFNILLLSTVIHILWQPLWITQMALNQHIIFSYLFLLTSLLTLVFSYYLISNLGILGAGISILFSELILMIISYITLKNMYKNL